MIKMPAPESSGFVSTLNRMGYMTSEPDEFSKHFICLAAEAKLPVLEVGAAYGVATLPALAKGAIVFANDIDTRHLEILKDRVTDRTWLSRLSLVPGSFPSEIDFKDNALEAILACRVLHFLSPEKISESFKKSYRWLESGGHFVVVAETPYLKNFSNFLPEYEARVKKRDQFPGYIENPARFAPDRATNLPSFIHFLDPQTLSRLCHENGFEIIECRTFARKDFPLDIQLDGRESVGLIARKP
jgi:ubiquinone/menaquinone biosynthesis C-methylase UbiE